MMPSCHRRRFLSAVSLFGLYGSLRAQGAAAGANALGQGEWYECHRRLVRGEIPGVEGRLKTIGSPENLSSDFSLEFTPEAGLYPTAAVGRFATREELRRGRLFSYPRMTFTGLYRFVAAEEARTDRSANWGDPSSGHFYVTKVEVALPPYVLEATIPRPLSLALEANGERVLAQEAATVSPANLPANYLSATTIFNENYETKALQAALNRLEQAGRMFVLLLDAQGQELARVAFATEPMDDSRRWLGGSIAGHLADMAAGLPPKTFPPASDGSGGGGAVPCMFTAATVGWLGRPDRCWELECFRRFRDEVLCRTDEGRALVRDYYQRAGSFVQTINRREDAGSVWARVYWLGVLPLAVLVRAGCRGLAVRYYRAVVAPALRFSTGERTS